MRQASIYPMPGDKIGTRLEIPVEIDTANNTEAARDLARLADSQGAGVGTSR